MSKVDTTRFKAAAMQARVEARRSLEVLTKATPGNRETAQADFDTAAEAYEHAELRATRAQEIVDGGLVIRDGASVRVGDEPRTYRAGGPHSWFKDQRDAQKGKGHGDGPALERIIRNGRELRAAGIISRDEERAVAGEGAAGGALAAPGYIQDYLVGLAGVSRPYVNNLTIKPLPSHVQTVDFPKIKSGAVAAAQANLGAVENVSLATEEVKLPIAAIAGTQDVAKQLMDRSEPALLDDVLLPNLALSYYGKSDVQALTGSGVAPNLQGVAATTGVNVPEWTEAAPKLAGFYKAIAYCKWLTWTKRFLPPNLLVMHPLLWSWIEEQKDTALRPLLPPHDLAAAEALELAGEEGSAEGPVGKLLGLRVVLDANISIKLGAGTNQTAFIVQRAQDSWFWEMPRFETRAYDDVESGTGAVRCQVWNYASLTHERYSEGISYVTGTGLIVPEPTI